MSGSFLICSWAGGGNATPAIHLGQRLRRRGHRVRLLGWESMERGVTDAGLEFCSYPSVPPWPRGVVHEDDWERLTEALFGAGTADDVVDAAEADMPDVLVVDCVLRAGFDAARRLKVPTTALTHVLYQPFVHEWGERALEVDVSALLGQADQVLNLSPPTLDEPGRLPDGTHYVGAITAPDPGPPPTFVTEPGEPWVLLSMSTTTQRLQTPLPTILAALGALPVRVLLTVGGAPPPDISLPANVTVTGFVPHECVLPYVDLVVGHGGLGTVTTSLAFGKPLVLIPQGREQPINSRRVDAVGAGRALAPDATAGEIARCVAEVLGSEQIRRAAAAFADPHAGEQAVRLVERLLPQRQPRPAARRSRRSSGGSAKISDSSAECTAWASG